LSFVRNSKIARHTKNILRDLARANYSDSENAVLSAKTVPIFADRGVYRSQIGGSPTVLISTF
jgi:hypothetical protein